MVTVSDRYRKTEAYECSGCGELHDHPSLAEKCSKKDELYRLANEIAELRIRGGICEGDMEHSKIEVSAIIEEFREQRDDLEEQYGDDCDHDEVSKSIDAHNGGVYCTECGEKVNEYPKDPETFTIP